MLRSPAAVPLRIDALWSDGTTALAPPSEDFSALVQATSTSGNYSNAKPWLGETADIPSNDDVLLPPGLHLHWTLPVALRRGTSVYVVTTALCNELVQQGVPCALVAALQAAAVPDKEYDKDAFVALLKGLANVTSPPLTPPDFTLLATPQPYTGLISSDTAIVVQSLTPGFQWDPIFLDIYAPTILHAAVTMKLPPVPDRWLVVRTTIADGTNAAWVVESDRLSTPAADGSAPAGAGPRAIPGAFAADFIQDWGTVTPQMAAQYLGLVADAANWSETGDAQRLSPLTAVGHGAPDFALFYPNCQGVFGFYDASAAAATAYRYTVIGWFSDPTSDPLSATYAVAPWAAGTTAQDRAQSLSWLLDESDWSNVDGSIYTAAIVATSTDCPAAAEVEIPQAAVDVAIGNTVAEALSAYLTKDETTAAAGLTPQGILDAAQAGVLDAVLGPDGPAIVENALHAQSFQPEAGGSVWQVAAVPPTTPGLSDAPQDGAIPFTPALAAALNALNGAQLAFDAALATQAMERHQLFADLCRALHLETDASGASVSPVFPNGSTLSNQGTSLANVAADALIQSAAAVRSVSVDGASAAQMAPYAAATALYLAYAAALSALAAIPDASAYYLRRQPAPQYWRPNDPVVMLAEQGGDNLVVNPPAGLPHRSVDDTRYLLLAVFTATLVPPAFLPTGWNAIPAVPSAEAVGGAIAAITPVQAVVSWRPLSLEWQTKYFPYPGAGSIDAASPASGPFTVTDYDPGFLSENFEPDATGIELQPKHSVAPDLHHQALYNGRVVLNGQAGATLRTRILQLTGQLRDPPPDPSGLRLPGILGQDPVKSMLTNAYGSTVTTLAQALDGFGDQLLMLIGCSQISKFAPNYQMAAWQQGNAAPLPLWDADSQSFFDEIGAQARSSPAQDSVYNPIRAGQCQLSAIVLVDSFGQRRRWQAAAQAGNTVISNMLPNETGSAAGSAPAFFLPPRLVQPSRLLFRWLAADGSNAVESNQDPAATPICGWIALDRVDETILLFIQDGTLIGWIAADTGAITYLPGHSRADITDPFLVQVVDQVAAPGVAQTFYDDVDQALLTIQPRAHRHHVSRSVLESSPIAIGRASLSLQLKGMPAPHQGYTALATMALNGTTLATEPAPSPYFQRETCGFENTGVPVRLGDVSMDDDGLVAFWTIEDSTIAASYQLVSTDPEAGPDDEPSVTVTGNPAATPRQVLLLFDPRAKVHATTGLLPVVEAGVANAMFADALSRMDYLMQVAPVLTPANQLAMPLPAETNGGWTWLTDSDGSWSDPATPVPTDAKIHPSNQPAVIRAGFLKTK